MTRSRPSRQALEHAFFESISKARPNDPVFRSIFGLMYEAHICASENSLVLNVFASHDASGEREALYREHFFPHCQYRAIDWWENEFITEDGAHHQTLPIEPSTVDILVTTKVVLEHTSAPAAMFSEFGRALAPGGEVFLIAPLIRRQHQLPHDYYRFTEPALIRLSEQAGLDVVSITASNGFAATAAAYAYFIQRGLPLPRPLERAADFVTTHVVEPLGFWLDRFDSGYGRDMTQYFLLRAKKCGSPAQSVDRI